MSKTTSYILLSVICSSIYQVAHASSLLELPALVFESKKNDVQSDKHESCASKSTIHRGQRHFSPTVFHTPIVRQGGNCRLQDENRKTLAKVPCEFKKHCDMQGVCFLKKGHQLVGYNFIKKKRGVEVYAEVDSSRCPYGYGVWSKEHNRSVCMDPYRSVAADNRYHKTGTVLFFPALKGLELPDNTVHDGYMVVRSTGGAIKGKDRFDFYTGLCENPEVKSMLCKSHSFIQDLVRKGFGQTAQLRKNSHNSCFYTYYKVPDSLRNVVLAKRNYPDLPQLDVLMAHSRMQNLVGAASDLNDQQQPMRNQSVLLNAKSSTQSTIYPVESMEISTH